jgi:hypothetical protein
MFISTLGRNFGESAAGMRFTRATQRAELTRAIANWSQWNNSANRSNDHHALRANQVESWATL